jgi:hypothetical protein
MTFRPQRQQTLVASAPRVWLGIVACIVALVTVALALSGCAPVAALDGAAGAALAKADSQSDYGSQPDNSLQPEDNSQSDDGGSEGVEDDVADPAYLPSLSPRVFGRCWEATAEEVAVWTTWRGGDYVPCDEQHTTYTYAAEDLPDDLLEAMRASPSDAADAALEVRIDAAVHDICQAHFADLFPRLTERQVMVSWFSFLPTDPEMDAGARWVRCDVGVYAVQEESGEMELTPLPANIHDLVVDTYTSPGDYQYCRWAPESSPEDGPLHTEGGRLSACDDTARWIFDGAHPLNYPEGTPWPGRDAVVTAAREACEAGARLRGEQETPKGWIYFPTEESWGTGDRSAGCWSTLP